MTPAAGSVDFHCLPRFHSPSCFPAFSAAANARDSRYCWLRDASLTLEALSASVFVEETALCAAARPGCRR